MIKTLNHNISKVLRIAIISLLVPYFAEAIVITEGIGTHFEITDSQYLNIVLDSSEPINLRMESVPEMVTMMIESPALLTATSTQIILSGFATSTTYYKYEDNYHNLAQFTTDANGAYVYTQEISTPHIVFIQPHKSTKFIRNDVTGGDCSSTGTWDSTTLICTLTADIIGTVQIDSNGITLDGNGHTITGVGTGNGTYLSGRTGVTIKNLNVTNFSSGIFFYSSNNNTLTNNTASNNNDRGIYLNLSSNNTLNNNTVQENGYSDIYVYASTDSHCNNNITNTTGSGGRSIKYLNSAVSLSNETLSELILCNADGSNINNIMIDGSIMKSNNGLVLMRTDLSTITNVNSSNNAYGIDSYFSSSNTLTNNTVINNYNGIFLYSSNNNIITNNTALNNPDIGIYPFSSSNNQIYNNNLINNFIQARVNGGNGNVFNLTPSIGGNYWSNFDTPAKGCNDANNDNFCDSPYVFYGGQDNLPWTTQDGWKIPTNQPPAISNLSQLKSDSVTAIAESGITTESTLVFKTTLSDADNDQVKLQVELKQSSQPFGGVNLLESGFLASGSSASVTKNLIPEGKYHWRARAVDDTGNASVWQEFGTAGNIDFEVKIPLSYKAANLAKELVNQPYLWGGKGWDYNQSLFADVSAIKTGYHYYNPAIKSVDTGIGVDCSGLVMWAYDRSFDPTKPRFNNFVKAEGADGQYRYNTATTTESGLQQGDVMFFDWNGDNFMDHVAMYVGESSGFDVVSASSPTIGIITRSKDSYKQISGFVAFKQVISALPSSVLVTAHSPVDLMVTDPDGFTITPTTIIPSATEYLREIPGVLYYSEMEKGIDGNPIDQVYSYTAKTGDYIIKVLPTTGALPAETYSLDFKVGEQTTILAQDVPLSQISNQGYGIAVSATGTINSFIPVVIDIKPNSYPNSINLGSNGVVPVAIFGSATFDVRKINPITIKLANASVKLKGNSQPIISYSDVNGDGFTDISVNVTTEALQLTANDVKANLEAQLLNGIIIKGSDSIRIVP